MSFTRGLLRLLLGRRLPIHRGEIRVSGCQGPVTVGRDEYGVPYIEAGSEDDVWFGLGFCHAQDRAGQLEIISRLVRGELAEMVGAEGLPIDRISRRVGFMRAAGAQLEQALPEVRQQIEAYVRGLNQGLLKGSPKTPPELALLRRRPTPWTAEVVQAYIGFLCFVLASNWDMELLRLKILSEDGPEALAALDPAYPAHLPVTSPPGGMAANTVDLLARDLQCLFELVGPGGASNAWAVSSARTATGRPILANDLHLATAIPNLWYLARLTCEAFQAAGGTFAGIPTIGPGHNGHTAWGLTAAHADNTDLFLEELGEDGQSIRQGDGFIPCQVIEETIKVRWSRPVKERVLVGPRGPIISPVLSEAPLYGKANALSLAATWLAPRPYTGMLRVHRARTFEEFRELFRQGSGSTVTMVYADRDDHLGWFLGVELPKRRSGHGNLPLPGWRRSCGWEEEPVSFEDLPWEADPEAGFLCAANNQPMPQDPQGPFLGLDWLDGFRQQTLTARLSGDHPWDVERTARLQMDTSSPTWDAMREAVLATPVDDEDGHQALALLRAWNGSVDSESPAAAVYELLVADLCQRVVKARAPKSAAWALGRGFTSLLPYSLINTRRQSHLVRLINQRPAGFFPRWEEQIAGALSHAVSQLRQRFGPDPESWAWGRVRTLTLVHPLGAKGPLSSVFNVGPLPGEGDANTVVQGGVDLADPLANQISAPVVRAIFDIGCWDSCRFSLAGGQSGNPFSPHYDDQIEVWRSGQGLPIAWSEEEVKRRVLHTLKLVQEQPEQSSSVARRD